MNFTFALSEKELKERTHPSAFTSYNMLDENAQQYNDLPLYEKKVLEYLVHASDIIDRVALKMDNPYNIKF